MYTFTVPAGGQTVAFDADGQNLIMYYGARLVRVVDSSVVGGVYGHVEYALAAGDYRIEVSRPGTTGTYWINTLVKP